MARRGGDELPHTLGLGAGHRTAVEGRLYDGHCLEFLGQVVLHKDVLELRHPVAGQTQDILDFARHFLGILDDIVADDRVVRDLDERIHLVEPFNENRIRNVRHQNYVVHVRQLEIGAAHIVLHIPYRQQRIGIVDLVSEGLVYGELVVVICHLDGLSFNCYPVELIVCSLQGVEPGFEHLDRVLIPAAPQYLSLAHRRAYNKDD